MGAGVLFGPETVIAFVADGNDFENKGGENMRRYTDVGQEVDQRTKNHMLIYNTDYGTSMKAILNADPVLKEQYTGIGTDTETYSGEYPAGKYTQKQIGEEIDKRVKNLLQQNSALSYPEAMIQVLQEDPDLKQAYHGSYYKQL